MVQLLIQHKRLVLYQQLYQLAFNAKQWYCHINGNKDWKVNVNAIQMMQAKNQMRVLTDASDNEKFRILDEMPADIMNNLWEVIVNEKGRLASEAKKVNDLSNFIMELIVKYNEN